MISNFILTTCIIFSSHNEFMVHSKNQVKNENLFYEINLIRSRVLVGQASILLPSTFTPLTQEEIKLKYPGNNRPVEVYGNETGTITVGLSMLDLEVPEKEFEEFAKVIVQEFRNAANVSNWYGDKIQTINGMRILITEYESPLPDGTSYNLTCYALMQNKVVVYTFNCLQNQKAEWQTIGFKIVESFQTVK